MLAPATIAIVTACSAAARATAVPHGESEEYGSDTTADSVADLPLTLVAASGPAAAQFAVLLTGDGGFASIDREIADSLARHGIPVVALDSRSYLSAQRNPEQASRDLERILTHYLSALARQDVLLIGYSRGANILPFMVSRLPADLISRVQLVALLGPATTANFKFHMVDLISDRHRKDDIPTLPEIAKLRGRRVLCFYGTDEKDSACPSLDASKATSVAMPGGHHFGQRYGEIAERILQQLPVTTGS